MPITNLEKILETVADQPGADPLAIAENARIPIDNPATHLELTMVHEAMVLEYSGRHLAMIELASALKLLLYVSAIACLFLPWGLASGEAGMGETDTKWQNGDADAWNYLLLERR